MVIPSTLKYIQTMTKLDNKAMGKRLQKVYKELWYLNEVTDRKEFAWRLCITIQSLRNYMLGIRPVPTPVLAILRDVYKININWLVCGNETQETWSAIIDRGQYTDDDPVHGI